MFYKPISTTFLLDLKFFIFTSETETPKYLDKSLITFSFAFPSCALSLTLTTKVPSSFFSTESSNEFGFTLIIIFILKLLSHNLFQLLAYFLYELLLQNYFLYHYVI